MIDGRILAKEDMAKRLVTDYILKRLYKSDVPVDFDVYIVWSCYILGNYKMLLSSTLHDGMYYEVTYNANKHEYYLDAYKKFENMRIADDVFDR